MQPPAKVITLEEWRQAQYHGYLYRHEDGRWSRLAMDPKTGATTLEYVTLARSGEETTMPFRMEHREDRDHEWTAIVFADGFTCAVSVEDPYRHGRTDALRVSSAPCAEKPWWIKLDRQGRLIAHVPECPLYGPMDTAILARVLENGPAIVQAAEPLFLDVENPVYIRFGHLPRGRSRNHATGELESGVSCYRARRHVEGGYLLTGPGLAGAAIEAAFGLYDAAFLVAGEECGRGSDGEPLLRNVRVLGRLRYETGRFWEE